jgi:hypothetical protein
VITAAGEAQTGGALQFLDSVLDVVQVDHRGFSITTLRPNENEVRPRAQQQRGQRAVSRKRPRNNRHGQLFDNPLGYGGGDRFNNCSDAPDITVVLVSGQPEVHYRRGCGRLINPP